MILNDDFANAQVLTGNSGSVTGNNDGATSEPGEPIHLQGSSANSNSVWYKWTPSQNGTATVDANTAFYTVVAVYSGTSLSNLQPVPGLAVLLRLASICCKGQYIAFDRNVIWEDESGGAGWYGTS